MSRDERAGAVGDNARGYDLAELPDLLALDLGRLRALDHPVLKEVLDELRARVATPGERLWGFDEDTGRPG